MGLSGSAICGVFEVVSAGIGRVDKAKKTFDWAEALIMENHESVDTMGLKWKPE